MDEYGWYCFFEYKVAEYVCWWECFWVRYSNRSYSAGCILDANDSTNTWHIIVGDDSTLCPSMLLCRLILELRCAVIRQRFIFTSTSNTSCHRRHYGIHHQISFDAKLTLVGLLSYPNHRLREPPNSAHHLSPLPSGT